MGRVELIALLAMMAATVAFSIDAMLPAMNVMAKELTPLDLEAIGLVITAFILRVGMVTFAAGPLSDAFERRRVMLLGVAIYIIGAGSGALASSL